LRYFGAESVNKVFFSFRFAIISEFRFYVVVTFIIVVVDFYKIKSVLFSISVDFLFEMKERTRILLLVFFNRHFRVLIF
jgi:hypothetical protein